MSVRSPADQISAILMASGFSKRFGSENKLLVPVRGKPLALHTLELVCGSGFFSSIFFVYADEAVAALADGFSGRITLIHNDAPQKGQRESVRLGTLAAAAADYCMFFPCDQPLLDISTVRLLVEARQPARIVEPCFQGTPGSPGLFSAAFRDELLNLGEGERPRVVKARHPEAVIQIPVANPLVLADIDIMEDIAHADNY